MHRWIDFFLPPLVRINRPIAGRPDTSRLMNVQIYCEEFCDREWTIIQKTVAINEGPNTDVNTKKVITADWAKSE